MKTKASPAGSASREGARPAHCWEDGPAREFDDGTMWGGSVGSTCMLLEGHDGPHEWTPDDQIGVSFAPDRQASPEKQSPKPSREDGRDE